MGETKIRRELLETAQGLLLLNLGSSEEEIQSLIDDGGFHLENHDWNCNETLRGNLENRINGAKFLLHQKREQAAGVFREVRR